MANNIQIYNIENHSLSGSALRKLNEFSTDSYCGIITPGITVTTPISGNSSGWSWNSLLTSPIFFLGGGCLLQLRSDTDSGFTSPYIKPESTETEETKTFSANTLWCIRVDFSKSENDNPAEINCGSTSLISLTATMSKSELTLGTDSEGNQTNSVGGVPLKNQIQTFPQYTIEWTSNPYDNGTADLKSITYSGNTCWINKNVFYIPLCYYDGSSITSIVYDIDKYSYENWLSANAVDLLIDKLDDKYTHQDGNTIGTSSTDNWGKVGNFNFKSILDKSYNTSGIAKQSNILFNDSNIIQVTSLKNSISDNQRYVLSISSSVTENLDTSLDSYGVMYLSKSQFSDDDKTTIGVSDIDGYSIKFSPTLPFIAGGTGYSANNIVQLQRYLGPIIKSGNYDPSTQKSNVDNLFVNSTVDTDLSYNKPQVGDIYLRVLE